MMKKRVFHRTGKTVNKRPVNVFPIEKCVKKGFVSRVIEVPRVF